jgi:hypothetical protein
MRQDHAAMSFRGAVRSGVDRSTTTRLGDSAVRAHQTKATSKSTKSAGRRLQLPAAVPDSEISNGASATKPMAAIELAGKN